MDVNTLLNFGLQPMQQGPIMTPEEKAALAKQLQEKIAQEQQLGEKAPTVMMSGPPPVDTQQMNALNVNQVGFIDPKRRDFNQDMMNKYKQLAVESEQGIEDLKQRARDVQNINPGIDLTALAALADKWGGGGNQLTQAAHQLAPMKPEEKAALLAKLNDQIQAKQQGLMSEVGRQLGSGDSLRYLDMQLKNQRQDKNIAQQMKYKFNQDVRNDVKNFYDITPSIGAVEAALVPDSKGMVNAQRVKMALSNAARLMGEKGVLTDQDILRVQGKYLQQKVAEMENFFQGPEATIPVEYVAQLKRAIEEGKASVQQATKNKVNATKETYLAMGLDPEFSNKVADNVYGSFIGGKAEEPKKDTVIDKAAIEAELKRRGLK